MLLFKVPFMREGILMGVKKIEQVTAEDSLQEINDRFGPQLKMATKDGLVYAGKLQAALEQEMVDHLVTTHLLEMVDPLIETGVLNVMNSLQSRGFSAPGGIEDSRLFKYIIFNIRYNTGKHIGSFYLYNELKNNFLKLIDFDFDKPLPPLTVLLTFQNTYLTPKINEIILQKVDEFRRHNPQLTQ